ncbi:MAG: resuscitation-promoting factor [Micropruina sp.]|uniref:resuscitation-promoting factor n=1 Tax=Micropruina sp. TaxID=2737536 RepID=UPI0039E2C613
MQLTTKGSALVACGVLLLAGLSSVPANAADNEDAGQSSSSGSTVTTKTSSKKVTLKYATVKMGTKSLYKGDSKVVTKGRNGKATQTYQTTTVDGVSTTVLVKEQITKKVVNKVVKVGTNGKHKINLARLNQWNKIAKCESGNRWHVNTGNGYYGGLQFNLATWKSVKGQHFAKYPHKATKSEQITVANRLYATRGFKPWSCRHVL